MKTLVKKQKSILSILLLVFSILSVKGQEEVKQVPIPVELVIGNNSFGLQSIINKNLPESKKLSFFSVSYFESRYAKNANYLDFINNSQLSYNMYNGFGISAGLSVNKVAGLAPTIGIQYNFANPKWLFVLTPNYIFSDDKNISVLSLIEYKPQLTNRIKLYSRVQGLYNQNIKASVHERSYLQFRFGLDYNGYQCGFAGNWDYYGADKDFKENYGMFIRTNLP